MEFLLKQKDGLDPETELKCFELKKKIRELIFECFSNELIAGLESHPIPLLMENGPQNMDFLGVKETYPKNGLINETKLAENKPMHSLE